MSRLASSLLRLWPGLLLTALAIAAAGTLTGAGERYRVRIDATRTNEQQLAPRTLNLLEQARRLGGVDVVVAVHAATLDDWSRRTVNDVLDLLEHQGGVRAEEIDVGSAEGQRRYAQLIDRLIVREQEQIDQHVERTLAAASGAEAIAAGLEEQLSPALLAARDEMAAGDVTLKANAPGIDQWAEMLRRGARTLADEAMRAHRSLTEPDASAPLPPLAQREAALRQALEERVQHLETLGADLAKLIGYEAAPASLKSDLRAVSEAAARLRDEAARHADALDRLPKLDVLRIAGALSSSEVALVIGPPGLGVAGLDIAGLYEPTILAADGERLIGDVRSHAEELFAAAVSSVLNPTRPIVVLVHGESGEVLRHEQLFGGVRARMSERGIEMVEWSAVNEERPPDLDEIDPDGLRPVVYVTLAPNSAGAAQGEGGIAGPERAAALGRAIQTILDSGQPLLVGVNPSILPAYGEPDPVVAPLRQMGIRIATGTPLLRQSVSASAGRRVETDFTVLPPHGDHALLAAISGLPTRMPWPAPMEVAPVDGVEVTELVWVDGAGDTWTESQWLYYWQTSRDQRTLLPDQPEFTPGVDGRADRWTVGVAIERAGGTNSRAGRVVVIGSNGWYANQMAFQYQTSDGRVSLRWPGNIELFESAVLWLAGMDEQIARSAGSRATPMVAQIEPRRLSRIRWALVAGLPLLTLVAGVAWRMLGG